MIESKHYKLSDIGDDITIIAITGGPCSGKTTGLARLSRMLADRGYKVLISPESATKLMMAGMLPGELPQMEFQEEITCDCISQESRIVSIAKRYRDSKRKVIVLCDRGSIDGEAYVGSLGFTTLLAKLNLTRSQICEERYHAVIHLRTAALGAEEFYTLENNLARTETVEVARSLDERTLSAWTRHQHPRVIDNSTDFDGKIRRLFKEVCSILGDPIPLEIEDKYLIERFDPKQLPVKYTQSHITQDYLVSTVTDEERRVRSRSDGESTTFYYTIKRAVNPGVRVEVESLITECEYKMLLTLRDPLMETIEKKRICFFWKEQFFEADFFEKPCSDRTYLEVERTDRNGAKLVPEFLNVLENVTGDPKHSNFTIAKLGYNKYD